MPAMNICKDLTSFLSQPGLHTRLQTLGTWIAVLYAVHSLKTTVGIQKRNERYLAYKSKIEKLLSDQKALNGELLQRKGSTQFQREGLKELGKANLEYNETMKKFREEFGIDDI